ncbi:MAG TPA: ABC transporter permease, partial [Aggregatilineales bacterium]|nr:ABC transporter permease [Aggregatilineales bacterium]
APALQRIRVQVVNLEQPASHVAASAGQGLLTMLQSDGLKSLLDVTSAPDEASARAAITDKEADVALIIPADFTARLSAPPSGQASSVTLVHDPVLTIGPRIVQSVVEQYLDIANGTQIAALSAGESFAARGVAIDPARIQQLAAQYASWASNKAADAGSASLVDFQAPATGNEQPGRKEPQLLASVMVSMIVFFMFFTGAQSAQSILTEEEQGTLARLFTTSVRLPTVLAGKLGAAWTVLGVQAAVLIGVSALIFGIQWGRLAAMIVLTAALIVACASFGLLIIAFIKNARQGGTVIGGVLTISGMLGGLFTSGLPNPPAFLSAFSLVLPQGWAMRGWQTVLTGGTLSEVMLPAAVLVLMGLVCFVVAVTVLRKRFA